METWMVYMQYYEYMIPLYFHRCCSHPFKHQLKYLRKIILDGRLDTLYARKNDTSHFSSCFFYGQS
jgi:hypothetical protein